MKIYHGSKEIIRSPKFKGSDKHNDYGPAFYATLDFESACIWATKNDTTGIVNIYNVNFDKSALNRLFGERFNNIELEYKDIIPAILHTKLMTKKYINFCRDNKFVTEKGNIQTKAETVYRYLTGCIDFEEEHTGLADVLIEYQILLLMHF